MDLVFGFAVVCNHFI